MVIAARRYRVSGRSPWLFGLALGVASQTAQVVLIREQLACSLGSELAIAAVAGVWMLAAAAGSGLAALALASPALGAGGDPARLAAVRTALALGTLVLVPLGTVAARLVPRWLGLPAGEVLSTGGVLAAAAVVAAVPAAAFGALFPLALGGPLGTPGNEAADESAGARSLYAAESFGAAVAGIALSRFLLGWISPGSLAAATTGGLVLVAMRGGGWRLRAVAASLVVIGCFVGMERRAEQWATQLAWEPAGGRQLEVVAIEDSPRGRLTVVRDADQTSFYRLGHLLFSFPDHGEMAPYVDAALLEHRAPASVLLIGGELTGHLAALVRHPVQRIVVIEDDDAPRALARTMTGGEHAALLTDPRVTVVVADPRRYVQRTGARFDAALVVAGEPLTLVANRLLTVEFAGELWRVLNDDGVLAVGPLLGEAGRGTPLLVERNVLLMRTLRARFGAVWATSGPGLVLLAGKRGDGGGLDLAELLERAAARGLDPVDLAMVADSWGVQKVMTELATGLPFDPLGATSGEAVSGSARRTGGELNRDSHPRACAATLAVWAAELGDPAGWIAGAAAELPSSAWLAPVLMLAAASALRQWRGGGDRGGILAAFSLGWWGAALEWLVLAFVQTQHGVLYQWIGGFLGVFMGGLGAGAWLGWRWGPGALPAVLAAAAIWTALGQGLFGAAAGGQWGAASGLDCLELGASFVAIAGCGVLVGAGVPAAIAAASSRPWRGGRRRAGWVYGADLAGGVAGMAVTALVLFPNRGASAAASVAAGVVLVAAARLLLPAGIGSARAGKRR